MLFPFCDGSSSTRTEASRRLRCIRLTPFPKRPDCCQFGNPRFGILAPLPLLHIKPVVSACYITACDAIREPWHNACILLRRHFQTASLVAEGLDRPSAASL